MKTIVLVAAFTASTMAFQSCTDGKANINSIPKSSEPIPVTVMELHKSSEKIIIKGSGHLTTDDETILAFKTGGIVNNVLVKEGDQIRKGQILATLDLTEINTLVSQARHGFEKAQRDFQRVRNLYRDSVATLEQLQNAETALAVSNEQLQAATFNRSFSQIHAPASGYVLRKFVNAGQVVGVGDPVLQTNGAVGAKWILRIGVSDKQWSLIKVGNSANISIDAFPDRKFDAAVIRKSESSDPRSGAFTVELEIHSAGAKFAGGMFGSAEIVCSDRVDSWSVPYEAVLDANDDEGYVFVTQDFKTAIRKPVTIESFNGTTVRISSGLEDAGALIVSGSAYLADRSAIIIVK